MKYYMKHTTISINSRPVIFQDMILGYIDTNLRLSLPRYEFSVGNTFGPSFLQVIEIVVHETYLMHGQDHKSL